MSYKTLLVHVEATADSDLRVQLSAALARELHARLIGVGGCVPAFIDSGFVAGEDGPYMQKIADQERADLVEAAARFVRIAGPLSDAVVWREGDDYPDKVVEACASAADLIVASASRGPHASTIDAGELALRAGIPVLAMPTDLMVLRRNRIVIGWKNTREARRAVTDALPLLREAEQVTVLQIQDEVDLDQLWDGLHGVIDRLRNHGVHATAETMAKGSGDAAADLVAFSEDRLADLIVCGAYGHGRLREWTFGGVTRGLLNQSTLPVLFSH